MMSIFLRFYRVSRVFVFETRIQLIYEFVLLSREHSRQVERRDLSTTYIIQYNTTTTHGNVSRHITEMFYHMTPTKYLPAYSAYSRYQISDVYRQTHTNPCCTRIHLYSLRDLRE